MLIHCLKSTCYSSTTIADLSQYWHKGSHSSLAIHFSREKKENSIMISKNISSGASSVIYSTYTECVCTPSRVGFFCVCFTVCVFSCPFLLRAFFRVCFTVCVLLCAFYYVRFLVYVSSTSVSSMCIYEYVHEGDGMWQMAHLLSPITWPNIRSPVNKRTNEFFVLRRRGGRPGGRGEREGVGRGRGVVLSVWRRIGRGLEERPVLSLDPLRSPWSAWLIGCH